MHKKKTPITIQIFLHNSLRNVQQKDKNIIQHFLSQKIKKSQLYFFFLFSGGTKQTTQNSKKKDRITRCKLKIPGKQNSETKKKSKL